LRAELGEPSQNGSPPDITTIRFRKYRLEVGPVDPLIVKRHERFEDVQLALDFRVGASDHRGSARMMPSELFTPA